MAKELSMVENNEKGKEARQYFIRKEKEAREKERLRDESRAGIHVPKNITVCHVEREYKAAVRLGIAFGLDENQAKLRANRLIREIFNTNCMGMLQITHLESESNEVHLTPTDIGKQLGVTNRKSNKALEEIGFQEPYRDGKNRLKWRPTDKGMPYAVLKDTGKAHTDGTPVTQLYWRWPVVGILKDAISELSKDEEVEKIIRENSGNDPNKQKYLI
jgi:hypothetical protein